MSEKRIVGVDIGTYAVKVVYLDPKGELSLEGVEYELVGGIEANVGDGRVSIAAPVGRAVPARPFHLPINCAIVPKSEARA